MDKKVKKNIELPEWAVKEIEEMAAERNHKFKPYVEWRLEGMAERYRISKKLRLKNSKK